MKLCKSILFICLAVFQINGMNPPTPMKLSPPNVTAGISDGLPYPLRSRLKRKSDEITQSENQSRALQRQQLSRTRSSRTTPAKNVPPKKRLQQLQPTTSSYRTIPPKNLPPKKRLKAEHEQQTQTYPNTILGQRSIWRLPQINDARIARIMEKFHVDRLVAQTLISRDYTDEKIEEHITTSYERDVPHPSLLKNAERAVSRITDAIQNKEPILVFGDYDVDGMTSSALLVHCLEPLGAQIDYRIPNRIKDEYGVNVKAVEEAARGGYKVLITVDNGITAFEPATRAKELGIDLIITDHHLAHDGLPDAYTIVDPHQPGCQYPFKELAGVCVAFKLMSLLYEQNYLELPKKAYELMMLGTIADVVPLIGENRFWAKYGLDYVNNTQGSIAFQKLRHNAKLEKPQLGSTDIAFMIAPQLNALGRLSDGNLGVQFLLSQQEDEVDDIGDQLCELNQERKKIQFQTFKAVKAKIMSHEISLRDDPVIVLSNPDWHPGVNGLVASRVVDRYYKPTILCQETENDKGDVILKGSGRSIAAFNLFEALDKCKDLLLGYGGHVYAAGLKLKKENLIPFRTRLAQIFMQTVRKTDSYHRHSIDCLASFRDLNPKMIQDFGQLEPFGSQNPQPTFLFDGVQVAQRPTFMGNQHVKCLLASEGEKKMGKFFFRPDMFYRLQELQGTPFRLIGHPDDNYWKGKRSIEINAVDVEKIQ